MTCGNTHDSKRGNASIAVRPLVSVVIPAYNARRHIETALSSVLSQTYGNFEIIVVDDGSTDATRSLVENMQAAEKRIQLLTIDNGGAGRARNIALSHCAGEYVFYLDADDMFDSRTLETITTRLEQDASDFAVFTFIHSKAGAYDSEKAERYFEKPLLGSKQDTYELLDSRAYFACTKAFRKSFLTENAIKFGEGHIYEDNVFVLNAVLCANRVSSLHEPLYIVRDNELSATRSSFNTNKHADDYITAVNECVDALLEHAEDPDIDLAKYYYARYAIKRFMGYYYKRVPRWRRKSFSKEFVFALNRLGRFPVTLAQDKQIRFMLEHRVFSDNRIALFRALTLYRKKIRPRLRR